MITEMNAEVLLGLNPGLSGPLTGQPIYSGRKAFSKDLLADIHILILGGDAKVKALYLMHVLQTISPRSQDAVAERPVSTGRMQQERKRTQTGAKIC